MLAINGGKPVRDTFLSYGKQSIDDDDIESVVQVLKSPFLTQGPVIEDFEEEIANYVGASYAVCFSNGTAALHAAYFAAGIQEGDEVITTPITFVATSNAALYQGATPVFADIDESTYNLSVSKVKEKLTKKTKAIVSVDYTGQPVDYAPFSDLAKKHHLVYISDGAHSLGATYKGKKVGIQADMTMFSFHPVKPITAGEGGVIVTNHPLFRDRLRLFRSHGISKNNINPDQGDWYYEMHELGMNYRMTDIQAALGLSQLKKIESFIKKRQQIASLYNEAFKELEGLIIPSQLPNTTSGWHLYVIRLDLSKFKVNRKVIFDSLRAENIGVHVHYIPVYKHPYYQQMGLNSSCFHAEHLYNEMITLPLYPDMNKQDVKDVIKAVNKVLKEYLQ
ncbi:UDP-4-keto-6-deoxy-N-acetylglucosamine [Bacillus sp. TS-2]|nr:UDP-4-keto-6-deoxy-N-acetylglucosamine [Bacillus sp. TS-2]